MFTLKIKSIDKLQLITILYLIFFVIYSNAIFQKFWYLKLLLLVAIFISFFVEIIKKQMVFLLLGIVSLQALITFYLKFYIDGNHSFVFFYLGVILIFTHLYIENRENILKKNTFWMLAIIMFFGVIQKLISPTFMSGDFMNFMFVDDYLFRMSKLIPSLNAYFTSNVETIEPFLNTKPSKDSTLFVSYFFENQQQYLYYFSWFVILTEMLFVGVLFLKNERFKHIFFILFLFSLLLTRHETGFLSLVSILCLAQLPDKMNKFFMIGYLLFFFTCVMLIHLGKGFY